MSQGDEAAFARLMQRYQQPIYVHVLTYLKRAVLAEEITQDIFMQVWRIRETLTKIDNFEGYLYILTRNRTISELRKRKHALDTEPKDDISSEWVQPDEQLGYKQLYHVMMDGIDKLPPRRQEIFKLSRLEGWTHAEIAQHLGISRHTVNEHIQDAMNFLRTWLRNHHHDLLSYGAICWLILYDA